MIKPDREYRNFASFNLIETRAAEDGSENNNKIVEGYASTFEPYDLFEFDGAIYREVIDRNAFNDADLSDVVFLRDHAGAVLARTKNNLISLMVDDGGLFTRTDLSKTDAAIQMFDDIKVKNYTQMSFAFTSDRDAEEWTETKEDTKTIYTRIIKRVKKVFDISAVAFPANDGTNIGLTARALFDGEIEKLKAERLENERRKKARQALELKIKIMEAKL